MNAAEMHYAVIVVSNEARAEGDILVTPAGARFWVLRDRDGWIEATSTRVYEDAPMPSELLTFASRDEAEAFARRWEGHPWWCIPSGEHEVVEVVPTYEQVRKGWERAAAPSPESPDVCEMGATNGWVQMCETQAARCRNVAGWEPAEQYAGYDDEAKHWDELAVLLKEVDALMRPKEPGGWRRAEEANRLLVALAAGPQGGVV